MKKLGKLLLVCLFSLSLFGCTQKEEPKKEDKSEEKEPQPPTTEPDNNQEEQFFLEHEKLQDIYNQLQESLIDHYMVMDSASFDGNTLTYPLANLYSYLQFTYQTEANKASISLVMNNEEDLSFEKEACISASDPSAASIASSIVNIVSTKGSIEYHGNTYSQSDNVFTITLNTSELEEYTSSMKAALNTYKNTDYEKKDLIQLILHSYALSKQQMVNSIRIEGNSTNVTNFTNQITKFIEENESRVEISASNGKKKTLSYKDEVGSIIVQEGQENAEFMEENGLQKSDTFISRLCLNQISQLSKLKNDDSLTILITPTNTTILITIEGMLNADNTPYKETIILTEDEIHVAQMSDSQSVEYSYSFNNVSSIVDIKEAIHTNTYSYELLSNTLNGWIQ